MNIGQLKELEKYVLISTIWAKDGSFGQDKISYIFVPCSDIKFNYSKIYTIQYYIDYFEDKGEELVDNFFNLLGEEEELRSVTILKETDPCYIENKKDFWLYKNSMYRTDKDLVPIVYVFDNKKDFSKAKMTLKKYI